ncbi:Hypothetical protein NTJ_01296 [Nesidiocoris tenuis]|uniref:Uncharacterized protein n=1 Tax=Nesidiocoris tenuis TaxID=355587 RepID=A0ABN7A883_9HEMI|nr:Hypothetical protein NTJ_01296 [Nesidiocoris tenuis]
MGIARRRHAGPASPLGSASPHRPGPPPPRSSWQSAARASLRPTSARDRHLFRRPLACAAASAPPARQRLPHHSDLRHGRQSVSSLRSGWVVPCEIVRYRRAFGQRRVRVTPPCHARNSNKIGSVTCEPTLRNCRKTRPRLFPLGWDSTIGSNRKRRTLVLKENQSLRGPSLPSSALAPSPKGSEMDSNFAA